MAIENARHIAVLEAKLEMREERLAEQVEEIRELRAMVARTQDALVAKESPEAYRDSKIAEAEAAAEDLSPEQIEERRRITVRAETNLRYIEELEEPLFKGAQNMIDVLTRPTTVPKQGSLHGNSES
jgi:uncharacterized protein (DUF3084 family)